LAAYDIEAGQLLLGDDGFVQQSAPGDVGMLVARARDGDSARMIALRGVFSRDDAWLATADLFRRDADGDYWRLDSVRDVIHTAAGPVFTAPIRDALGTLPAIDLAVAYAVGGRDGHELAVAAVTVRHGHELDAQSLSAALRSLPAFERPAVVRVLDEIPVTTWYRPLTGPLREQGIPEPGEGEQAWYLDRGGKTYRPLTAAARKRLAAAGRR
jgi:putative long chain acyl-CoA synthase